MNIIKPVIAKIVLYLGQSSVRLSNSDLLCITIHFPPNLGYKSWNLKSISVQNYKFTCFALWRKKTGLSGRVVLFLTYNCVPKIWDQFGKEDTIIWFSNMGQSSQDSDKNIPHCFAKHRDPIRVKKENKSVDIKFLNQDILAIHCIFSIKIILKRLLLTYNVNTFF